MIFIDLSQNNITFLGRSDIHFCIACNSNLCRKGNYSNAAWRKDMENRKQQGIRDSAGGKNHKSVSPAFLVLSPEILPAIAAA